MPGNGRSAHIESQRYFRLDYAAMLCVVLLYSLMAAKLIHFPVNLRVVSAVSFISCVSFFRLLRMERYDTGVSTNYINITLPNPINLKPRQIEDGVSPLFPMTFVLVIREKTYLPSKASSCCHGSKVLQLYWFGLILKVGCQQFLQKPQVQVPVGFKPSMNTMIWKDVL